MKIGKPFYLAIYPVTQGEYEKVMGINPSAFSAKQMEASAFQPPLSEAEVKYRLPDAKKVAGQDTSRHPVETVSWEDCEENVWQWCADWYDAKYYASSPGADPPGPTGGSHRVFRGGNWGHYAPHARSAYRAYYGPGYRLHYIGLRVCLVPAE